jgi:hypothetical protein
MINRIDKRHVFLIIVFVHYDMKVGTGSEEALSLCHLSRSPYLPVYAYLLVASNLC